MIRSIVFLSLLGLSTGCAHHQNAPTAPTPLPETGWNAQYDQRYSPSGWPEPLYADVYTPTTAGPHPAVLVAHGGGWTRRSRGDMSDIAETLASVGFVVMNIDYRFAPAHRFPAQLHDLQVAMHWLHDRRQALSIDRERIGALGFSSGGHLVSLLGVVAGDDGALDQPWGGPETRLAAVVSGGTPSDLRKFGDGKLVEQLLGGTIDEVPDAYHQASPVVHVDSDDPPFFLFHGTWDMLVPIDQATDFHATLQAHGVHSELYRMRGRGHIASFLTSGSAIEAGARFLRRTLSPSNQ
ncbi:lipase [Tamilnaduibacter salinus]|uniref:Lipase n=1 Tax=Tamilnaduibacter salinus TaxID=1484056 RepID=A0A2A2I1P5_9GAMM|nr:alpha/beta hydrolase [Tamilnaduibacter salinus]PAV25055.1 lipase [Tamilnaduibacter salinus]